ncbi:BTAD domain-containing putative transcriptional regulator [Streptomyces longwoodensis]|uniref:BTAD domain-containing putative transcriptional regulator n=1 Tax=Streptomyces longwoodensis TaxID=68231 RepID=UPI00384C3BC9
MDAREHFHQTRLHALEAISRRYRRAGRMCEALVYAMTAVEAEPLRESAHREVTAVHLGEGNVAPSPRRLLAPCLGRPADASPPPRQRGSPGTPRR